VERVRRLLRLSLRVSARSRQSLPKYPLQGASIGMFSHANTSRPRALEFIREGDVLMVPKLDRLTRSVPDLCAIEKYIAGKGAALRANNMKLDTSTPTGNSHMKRYRPGYERSRDRTEGVWAPNDRWK